MITQLIVDNTEAPPETCCLVYQVPTNSKEEKFLKELFNRCAVEWVEVVTTRGPRKVKPMRNQYV